MARELGTGPGMLSRWSREAQLEGKQVFGGSGKRKNEYACSLARELARVKKKRDFLREAATFSARGRPASARQIDKERLPGRIKQIHARSQGAGCSAHA